MAVDYLKTYLGIDPDDYSSMEARIRGDEPQAQASAMMQPRMMPQARSLGEMEAMPMAPRSQPTPQVDDRYQSLMDEISSLKAQIEGMQAPTEQAPVMADEPVSPSLPEGIDAGGRFYTGPNGENMYQPPMPKIGPGQFQAMVMPPPINLDTGMELDSIISGGGGANTSVGSTYLGDDIGEMKNTPPKTSDYYSFSADPDTGFLQIKNPDAEGILKYGNDPKRGGFYKAQYDEYLNLFDILQKRRDMRRAKPSPEQLEKMKQQAARFKELYNMFGVIGTGGAYTPLQEGDTRPPIEEFYANQVYDKYAIDKPERTPPTQTEMPTTYQVWNPKTGKMETLPIPANMQMPGMPSEGISGIPNPMTGETTDGLPYEPQPSRTPGYDTLSPNQPTQGLQAPLEIQNRMVGEPQPIPQAPSQDIQASIDYLAKLPKMNIPQIPDMEQIRQKMEEANMTFPELASYQDQFQAVASKPNLFARQQPQMQSVGRPSLPISRGFIPEMRADGGGIDKAIYDLKFKLNG